MLLYVYKALLLVNINRQGEKNMSFQEKRNIVSLITTLLIFPLYCMYFFHKYQESSFSSTNEYSFWGAFILILIPVSIVAKIIIHIVFSMINTIATNDK